MGRSTSVRIVSSLLAIVLIVYIFYQVFRSTGTQIKTETAILYSTYDKLNVPFFAIRDEEVIYKQYDGVLAYSVPDGGKVAVNGVVAQVYSSDEAVAAINQIGDLKTKIENLNQLESQSDGSPLTVDMLDRRINDSFISLLDVADSGSMSGFSEQSNEFLNLLNQRELVLNKVTDFSEEVSAFETELAEMESSYNETPIDISTQKDGYFNSVVDGYEKLLRPEDYDTITSAELESLTPGQVPSDAIGKMIYNNVWYLASVMSGENARELTLGNTLQVEIPGSDVGVLPVKVVSINKDLQSENVTVVFSCDYMNREIAMLRHQQMYVRLNAYSGIRVSNKAIRVVDDVRGVFVKQGYNLEFKPVDILYSGNGYSICKYDLESDSALKIYDMVVVEGKDLYDGKIVNG